MASEVFRTVQPPGQTIYAVVWYSNQYFDWVDGAFETPSAGSHGNASLAAAERTRGVQSTYETSSVNLATLWNYLAPREMLLCWYLQAGGSPNPTTDTEIRCEALTVQMGERGTADKPPTIDVQVTPGFRIDESPQVATWWVTVNVNGTPVDLSAIADAVAPTCTVTVREEDALADEFIATATAPEADYGRFYVEKNTPGFTAERTYIGRVNIGSGTIVRDAPFLAAG